VLVGGSAGKGSACAFLASILQAAGLRIGLSPKPHLLTPRERAQVDGALISEARFAELMAHIKPLAEQAALAGDAPSAFEIETLLAFLYFAESRIDRAVVEVGLGGRTDATNVLPADLTILTIVGLDHTEQLGDTVEAIAREKAGIIKPGGRVVTGAGGPALDIIEATAREQGASLRRLDQEIRISHVHASLNETHFDLLTPEAQLHDLRLTLVGEHQAHNAALAAAAALWLREDHPGIDEAAIRRGLERAALPGRLQVVRRAPLVLLDGAHSPQRADALATALETLYLPASHGRLLLVIGCTEGHAPEAVVERLAPLAAQVFATRSRHPGAVPAAVPAMATRALGIPVAEVESVAAAVKAALAEAAAADMILVTGSLYIVAEALVALEVSA